MKTYTLIFALLFFGNFGQTQALNVTTNIINPSFCRTAGFQNGGGVLSCIVSGGSGNHYINWLNQAGIVFSNNSIVAGLNPGLYIVEVIDSVTPGYFIDSIQLDSVNPIADFTVNSTGLINLGNDEYLGHISVDVEFVNNSQNFAIPNFAPSDTTFSWTLNTNNPVGWFFTYDLNSVSHTYGPGEYEVGLVAKNHNDCRDTAYARIKVEETANIQSNAKHDILVMAQYDQKMVQIVNHYADANLKLKIFNINGQLIETSTLSNTNTTINFNHPKGIYFYQISNHSGLVVSEKFRF